jgi:hypothetical protein
MSLELQTMEKYLLRSIEEFDSNPLAVKLMRRLAGEVPEMFMPAAIKHLRLNKTSNAHRLLTVLLLRQDKLLEHLATPANNTRDGAVNLFRRFLEVDTSFDVKMAHKLPGRSYLNQSDAFDSMRSARALDILDETSRGRRLLPILGHLPESSDNRISSKATLFVGRRVQNPEWTRKQLARSDQRIRANAVEALWGLQTPPTLALLEECVNDQNHRVAGNSLVGLHLAGRENVLRETMTMSRLDRPEARSTAAWVMGKIGKPAFAPRLAELVRDEHAQVRGTALRALMDVRRQAAAKTQEVVVSLAAQQPPTEKPAVQEELVPEGTMAMLNETRYIVRR